MSKEIQTKLQQMLDLIHSLFEPNYDDSPLPPKQKVALNALASEIEHTISEFY